jgi:hypothetical protein
MLEPFVPLWYVDETGVTGHGIKGIQRATQTKKNKLDNAGIIPLS